MAEMIDATSFTTFLQWLKVKLDGYEDRIAALEDEVEELKGE